MPVETAKPAKKKLIRIEGLENTSKVYQPSGMNFGFITSPETGRKQASSLCTCREQLVRIACNAINNKNCSELRRTADMSRLRLLIVIGSGSYEKSRLFSGKAALNTLEAINNWEPSKITSVKHTNYENAYLLTGPKEWLMHPQLLSLAGWVLRLSAKNGPFNTENMDTLEKSWEKLIKASNSDSDVTYHGVLLHKRVRIFLENLPEIFKGVKQEDSWPATIPDGFSSYSGISTFAEPKYSINYSSAVSAAQKRFAELCKGLKK